MESRAAASRRGRYYVWSVLLNLLIVVEHMRGHSPRQCKRCGNSINVHCRLNSWKASIMLPSVVNIQELTEVIMKTRISLSHICFL